MEPGFFCVWKGRWTTQAAAHAAAEDRDRYVPAPWGCRLRKFSVKEWMILERLRAQTHFAGS